MSINRQQNMRNGGHKLLHSSSLLQGVKPEDVHLILDKPTGKKTWDALVEHKTKRDISKSIAVLGQMMINYFREGGDSEKWLQKMNGLRQQLRYLGEDIGDDWYARLQQINVVPTHRHLFHVMNYHASKNNTPLDPKEVISILLTENEAVKNAKRLTGGSRNGGAKDSEKILFMNKHDKGKHKRGRYKAKSGGTLSEEVRTATSSLATAFTGTCWVCGKRGHRKVNCPDK